MRGRNTDPLRRRIPQRSPKQKAILAAMARAAELESERLHRRISYIHLIVTIAPLIGLLGTVWGLLWVINAVPNSNTLPRPDPIPGGIMEAFVSTWMGLSVAIPGKLLLLVLKNRVTLRTLEANGFAKYLMEPFTQPGLGSLERDAVDG